MENLAQFNKYHNFLRRAVASLIDIAIVLLPFYAIYSNLEEKLSVSTLYIMSILQVLAPGFYNTYLHYKYGQTFGKMALSIKVIDLKSGGGLSIKQAFIRSLPIVITCLIVAICTLYSSLSADSEIPAFILDNKSLLLSLWTTAELICMFTNKERKTIHDLMAGTVVVNERYLSDDQK